MSVIQEDEAKLYPDLYRFENQCIDFLRAMKCLRQNAPNCTPHDALIHANQMYAFLYQVFEQLEKANDR